MLLMFILGSVSAQNTSLNIKGIVRDAMGDPIIGATILQQGSTYGTISNKDGEFSLSVPDKSMLEISFIGYQTKIVKVTAQKREFNIVLEDDTQVLADVVVVGYGVQKKSDLTSSISTIKSEQLSSTSITSLDQGIQGRAAGVAVLNTSVEPHRPCPLLPPPHVWPYIRRWHMRVLSLPPIACASSGPCRKNLPFPDRRTLKDTGWRTIIPQ